MALEVEQLLSLFNRDGAIGQTIPEFESRPEQTEMAVQILKAYKGEEIALIEAETGTGKSLAYLLPALLWAVETKERTVISTHTINLQEQLLTSDIPLLTEALGLNLKVALAKGMGNYLCLRKLEESRQEFSLLSQREQEEMAAIEAWADETSDGSLSTLSFSPSYQGWGRVAAEHDTCTGRKCPFYEKCHFFKARKEAEEAQLVIVNHSLLFADLFQREQDNNYDRSALLPPYRHLILDEAHHLEEVATHGLAARVSYLQMAKALARIGSEKRGRLSFVFAQLGQKYRKDPPKIISSILKRIHLDLTHQARELQMQIDDTFHIFHLFTESCVSAEEAIEPRSWTMRLTQEIRKRPRWEGEVVPSAQQLIQATRSFTQTLQQLLADIASLKDPPPAISSPCSELLAMAARLSSFCMVIETCLSDPSPHTRVQWVEIQPLYTQTNVRLIDAELDLSETLAKALFRPIKTVVLCSATLSTNQRFDFFRKRLGVLPEKLPERQICEQQHPSPFDYRKQALLLIPTDLPSPDSTTYIESLADAIWQAIRASAGNAFVLFTSYHALKLVADLLAPKLKKQRYPLLKQGDEVRHLLVRRFVETERSVLFGTYSFWEGVDVPGEALRCVVITKLPFKVPSEPLLEARAEALIAQGEDPFYSYALPQAILKFRQGFGRLIRKKRDRGCVVCLDSRLVRRPYGKLFFRSLPDCERCLLPVSDLYAQMRVFYRKTYPLVKGKSLDKYGVYSRK